MITKHNESTQSVISHRLKRAHLPICTMVALCGLLPISAEAVQAAGLNAQLTASEQVNLTLFSNDTISFLYPKAWFTQVISGANSVVFLSSDQAVLKAASSGTPKLTTDQLLVEVISGPAAANQVAAAKTSGSAIDILKGFVTTGVAANIKYGSPEAINLMSTTDAAEISAQDIKTQDEGLIILLSPNDHPVLVVGLAAPGQLTANQLIIQGIASTVQPDGASMTSVPATPASNSGAPALTETFSNKIYTLKYPSGWLTEANSDDPSTLYLASDQALIDAAKTGKFSLTSGQTLVGLASGASLLSLTGNASGRNLSASDLLIRLSSILSEGTSAILTKVVQPTTVTIGTQSGAEALVTLKDGGSGYLIVFMQGKSPIALIGFTAAGEAEASRALFEQMAASITLSTP